MSLTMSLVCIDWINNRRLRWRPLAAMLLSLMLIFGAMAIALQKGEARADATLAENFVPVAEGVVLYAGGGIVAFDRVVRDPSSVPHNWQITRVFFQVANNLGARLEVPPLHAEYADVGPDGLSQNVYTMYFAYYDLGIAGMMLTVAVLGFAATLLYRKALKGDKVLTIVYGFVFGSLLLSPYSETLFMGLNFGVKIWAIAWLVYEGPSRIRQLVSFLGRVKPERAYP